MRRSQETCDFRRCANRKNVRFPKVRRSRSAPTALDDGQWVYGYVGRHGAGRSAIKFLFEDDQHSAGSGADGDGGSGYECDIGKISHSGVMESFLR